jgi:hypothetical protein
MGLLDSRSKVSKNSPSPATVSSSAAAGDMVVTAVSQSREPVVAPIVVLPNIAPTKEILKKLVTVMKEYYTVRDLFEPLCFIRDNVHCEYYGRVVQVCRFIKFQLNRFV